jgi:hypothetical protein
LEGERLKEEIKLDDKEHALAIVSVVFKKGVTDAVDLTESTLHHLITNSEEIPKLQATILFVQKWRNVYTKEGIYFRK